MLYMAIRSPFTAWVLVMSLLLLLLAFNRALVPLEPKQKPSAPVTITEETIGAIMLKTQTDKLNRHAYDRYYDRYFAPFRHKKDVMILEIGADNGMSMRLWAEYFTKPKGIHGISYGVSTDQKKVACDWKPSACEYVKIFTGDQSDPVFLKSFTATKYDLIVDDGSHLPAHQITSFSHLFPDALKDGGLYVIEDLETSYWDQPGASIYGYSLAGAGIAAAQKYSAIEKLKLLVDVLMRFHVSHSGLSIFEGDKYIADVTFGQGLVIIRKNTAAERLHTPSVQNAPVKRSSLEAWQAKASEGWL